MIVVVGSLAILSAQPGAPARWATHHVEGMPVEHDRDAPVDADERIDYLEEEAANGADSWGLGADLPGDDPGEVPAAFLEPYRWTAADVLAARDRATPRARCVVDREIGGVGYDPWHRGSQDERGPVQLHPRGLLPEYLVWSGGQAPENPYYAVPFLEYKLRQGQGRHWAPILLGYC